MMAHDNNGHKTLGDVLAHAISTRNRIQPLYDTVNLLHEMGKLTDFKVNEDDRNTAFSMYSDLLTVLLANKGILDYRSDFGQLIAQIDSWNKLVSKDGVPFNNVYQQDVSTQYFDSIISHGRNLRDLIELYYVEPATEPFEE